MKSDRVVVDASVSAKWWLLDEDDNKKALEIFERSKAKEISYIVPHLWLYELASIF